MLYIIHSTPIEILLIISMSLLIIGFTLNKIVTKIKGAPLDTWGMFVPLSKFSGVFFLIMALLKF